MGAVVIYGLDQHLIHREFSGFEWKSLPLFLGGAAFLFVAHPILIPLANSCGDIKRFPGVLNWSMVFVTAINIVFAAMCFLYFTSGTCGSVIKNLGPGPIGTIVRVGISLEVMASFPLVAGSGFQALETGFQLERLRAFPFHPPGEANPHFFSRNIYYYVFRCGIVAILALFASTIKSFGLLVSLVGSLTIAATGFIFPQLFYLKLFYHEAKNWDKVLQVVIIVFGVGMTIWGTEQSIVELVDAFQATNTNSSSC